MKKIVLLILALIMLAGCDEISSSMLEPVDPNDTTKIEFVVETGESVKSVANRLDEMKLVSTAGVASDYFEQNDLSKHLKPGTYQLSRSMSLKEIVHTLAKKQTAEGKSIKITFPEGFEVKDIIARLEKNGLVKDPEEFKKVLKEGDFDFDFLDGVNREYLLEGYLFPDTYEFYEDASYEEIIKKFLVNFDKKFDEEMRTKAKEKDMSIDEVIILASIIEREARAKDEFTIISGVFQNRIKEGMPLQACSTVQYVLGERKPVLSIADTKIDSPYNTYINKGLPPAPIASPSLKAIKAALEPEETDYLFFVVKNLGDGSHYFSKTYSEHLKNIELSKKNLEEHGGESTNE